MIGNERSTKVAAVARAALVSNLASMAMGLAVVPLSLRALGSQGYGTFQVLVSLGNLALMADVGLGLALLTRVGQLAGAHKHEEIRRIVGGALMVISFIVALLCPAMAAVLLTTNVPAFLKVPPALQSQALHGCFIVLAAFAVRMPLSVLSSAHAGMQLGNRLVKWTVSGNMAASASMVVVATLTQRIDLSLGVQAAFVLAGQVGAARLGCALEPCTRPSFSRRYLAVGWDLMRSGFVYYLLQLEVMIIGSIDNLVISKILGVEAVAVYSIAYRLINLAFSMVYSLGASFWGGVAQAVGANDKAWIRNEAARLRRLGTLWMAVLAGGFAAVGAPAISLWTGGRLSVDPWLPAALGTYFALLGHTMIDASILNGAEKIKQQVVMVGLDASLNLALSIWLAHRLGYVGVGLATLVAYSTFTFLSLQFFSWKLVVEGARPPFWTRSLSAMVLAIAAGVLLNRLLGRLGWGPLLFTLVGGFSSLAITVGLIRLIVGRAGLDVLTRSLSRKGRSAPVPPTSVTAPLPPPIL